MRPPLRQHVHLAADREAGAKPFKRLVDQRPLAPFESEQEERHGGHEGVGERDIEAVEKEVVALLGRGGGGFGLIELGLDARGDPRVAALAGSAIVEDAGAQGAEIAAHQLREGPLDGRKVVLGLDDGEQRIGARRQMGEVIGRSGHDEMKVAIDLLAVALGHHGLKRRGRLLEGGARLRSVAAELAKAQAKAQQGIGVGMEIVAELGSEARRVGRESAGGPEERAGLAACYQPAREAGGRRFCDVGRNRCSGRWHRQSLDHRPRR